MSVRTRLKGELLLVPSSKNENTEVYLKKPDGSQVKLDRSANNDQGVVDGGRGRDQFHAVFKVPAGMMNEGDTLYIERNGAFGAEETLKVGREANSGRGNPGWTFTEQ